MTVVAACSPTPAASDSTATPTTAPATPSPSTSPSSAVVGTPFESTRYRYALVLPAGWSVVETPGVGGVHPDEPGVDSFRDGQGHILSVVAEPLDAGAALDTWTCAIGRHLSGEHQAPIESTEAITVAGQASRLTRYHVHFDPYVIHYLNVELVNGEQGLTLSMESSTGDDVADEALLRSLVDSLRLVG